ncbi:energy transducer TonB [bacterium]|nr:energy transducer TonB [bacterium]
MKGFRTTVVLLVFACLSWGTENYTAPEPAEPIEPPVYPPAALEDSFEGECRIGLLIGGDGSVSEAWIVKTSGREDIDLASLDTARETRWNPATLNGVPVSSRITVPFTFKLGILPGDPLAPVAPEPVETLETSEPVLELRPLEPLRVDYLPVAEGGFAIVGVEADELGLVLKAWIIRTSGHRAADEKLLDAVYATRWECAGLESGLSRGMYVHVFGEDAAISTIDADNEDTWEESATDQSGGACAFDQLKIGKYGQR